MAGGAGGMPQGGAGQSVMPQGGASQTPASSVMTDDFRGAPASTMPFSQMVQQLGMGQGASYNAPAPSMVPNYGSAANPQVQPNGAVYAGPMSGTPAWGGTPPQGAPAMGNTTVTPEALFSQLYGVQSPFAAPSQSAAPTPMQNQPIATAATATPGIAGLQARTTTPQPPVRAKQLSTPYRRPRMYR